MKYVRAFFRPFVLLMGICVLYSSPLFPQAQSQQQPERVIINFILPIQTDTMNTLVAVVSAQARMGIKKVTIIVSSPGGDTAAAYAAYNVLTRIPSVEITTFNTGTIDSAAMILFCAGKYRYSLPDPARFLIHGNALMLAANARFDSGELNAEVAQVNNLDKMTLDVIAASAHPDRKRDIEAAIHSQAILTPSQAKDWGIINEVRLTYWEPNSTFISLAQPPSQPTEQKPATDPVITSVSTN